ncbi:MAG: hypothetical protein J0653_06010, partial [Deltaproteobacteria bacterium]|nr:hypothetical protein [Deltaproteobacteria bacterium]
MEEARIVASMWCLIGINPCCFFLFDPVLENDNHLNAMCAGIEYNGKKILFTEPSPMLPVLMADGAIEWFAWGKPFA